MITFNIIKYSDVHHLYEDGFINKLIPIDPLLYFSQYNILGIYLNGVFVGFFQIEDTTHNGIEVHAFILEEYRKHSMNILKEFRDTIFHKTPYENIFTTVIKEYKYVGRILKMIGFEIVKSNEDITYFKLSKENYNG